MPRPAALLSLVVATALTACGPGSTTADSSAEAGADAHGGNPARPSCTMIVSACHDNDPGFGPAHECHELAEASAATEESCAMALARCLAACTPSATTDAGADASASGDAGARDHDH